jgi:2,4-didehydro-3-deoxy-L-rhamnonate hydrolase
MTPFALGTFSSGNQTPFAGLVLQDRVLPLEVTMLDLLADWERSFAMLQKAVQRDMRPLREFRVHAPVPRPGTVYCSGANYKKHVVDLIIAHQDQAETQGMTLEQKRVWGMKLMDERAQRGTPFVFIKPQSAVTGPFDPIVIPREAKKPDWELELAVVIGRRARRVPRERALEYVAGYTIVNDITLREKVFRRKTDSPELGMDFTISKGALSFLPMGPYMVPAAFVGDPQRLRVTLKLNGQVMQDEETADMIFTVAHLIEYLSASVELQPGDIICTGSPAGNGMHYNRFIQPGDVLEGSITGLGTQRNPCIAEPIDSIDG